MGRGLTFDTGALIAIERRGARIKGILAAARTLAAPITVPTVVVAEWWRGQKGPVARILGVIVEPERGDRARRRTPFSFRGGAVNSPGAYLLD